jgi:hypothetical protein
MMAANVADGAITTAKLADGSITSTKLAANVLTANNIADNAVTSDKLADDLDLGAANVHGSLDIFSTSVGTPSISLNGAQNRIDMRNDDGGTKVQLTASGFGSSGMLTLYGSGVNWDNSGPNRAALLTANLNLGGALTLYSSNGSSRASLAGANSGGRLFLSQADGSDGAKLYADNLDGAGQLSLSSSNGVPRVHLYGQRPGSSYQGGELSILNSTGLEVAELVAHSEGSSLTLRDEDGSIKHWFTTVADGNSIQRMYNAQGSMGVILETESFNDSGRLRLNNASGLTRVQIDGHDNLSGAGAISIDNANGVRTVYIVGDDANGNGRVTTQVLQITGGSDLSEQFNVNTADSALQPGMVVCIDPTKPGDLKLSSTAYDQTVAGVLSGAGGVQPGMLMGQAGTAADGKHPVALTGRVYCYVDATRGAIQPGDLLTTSDTPGHAMKAVDHTRAQGARSSAKP